MNAVLESIAPYRKAVAALVAPAVPLVIVAMQDGSPGGSPITGAEWLVIGLTCLASGGGTYATPPNRESGDAGLPGDG